MAKKQVPFGFAEDGLTITNPTGVVINVVDAMLRRINLLIAWRKDTTEPIYTAYNPAIEPIPRMLAEVPKDNEKTYFLEQEVGLKRVSASATNNCCWFDAFLTAMYPDYRKKSFGMRQQMRELFRGWCAEHTNDILAQIPRDIFSTGNGYSSDQEVISEIANLSQEIDAITGFFIAWYFGVNCVYIHREGGKSNVSVLCTSAYKSDECKTLVIYNTGNHFEPMGVFEIVNGKMQNATFMFDWSDPRLCKLIELGSTCNPRGGLLANVLPQWQVPAYCPDAPTGENYKLLGVKPNTPKSNVKKAFRRILKAQHPDKGGAGAGLNAAALAEARNRVLAAAPNTATVPAAVTAKPPTPPQVATTPARGTGNNKQPTSALRSLMKTTSNAKTNQVERRLNFSTPAKKSVQWPNLVSGGQTPLQTVRVLDPTPIAPGRGGAAANASGHVPQNNLSNHSSNNGQTGGKRRRTRKRLIKKRRSQTKKRRTNRK
jgi:hypothetical protein